MIKLGVVGTGMAWEQLHYPALSQMADKYQIAALCNKTRQKAEACASKIGVSVIYDDVNQLVENKDIDAVLVAVPISENYEVARIALESGKNVIAEKPLATTIEAARELRAIAERKRVKLMVAENYRYNEESVLIKDLLDNGRIGQTVYFVENNMADFKNDMKYDSFAAKEWRQHPVFNGGIFLDGGIHDIARMRYLFGEPKRIFASGRPMEDDYNEFLSINAQIVFQNNVVGQYNYFCGGQEMIKPSVGMRIFGTQGGIFLENKMSGVINTAYADGTTQQISFVPDRGYYNEFMDFYNCLTGDKTPRMTAEKEIGDIHMLLDIIESAHTNRIIYSRAT